MCLGIDVSSPVPESRWPKWPSGNEGQLDDLRSLEAGARFYRFPTSQGCLTPAFDVPQTFIQWSSQMHTEIPKKILFIIIFSTIELSS